MAWTTGLKETDLAQIARAKQALKALHALSVRLCYHRPTEDDIIELREKIHEIGSALEIVTLWLGPKKSEEMEAWLAFEVADLARLEP